MTKREVLRMRHILAVLSGMVLVSALCLGTGCLMFYSGSVSGHAVVVAERNEPGRPRETILLVDGRANWTALSGPDGAGDTHFNSVRYYLASEGRTNSLSHATRWAYDNEKIEGAIPIRGTDRWMLAYAKIESADTVTLDLRVFTARRTIARHEIKEVLCEGVHDALRGYGVVTISQDGRTITIPTQGGDCVLNGETGELTRPEPTADRFSSLRRVQAPEGVSLYDVAADRILWTLPGERVLSARTDTNTFITCASDGRRRILRLRDGTGSELSRYEIVCEQRGEITASPNLRRVAYLVERETSLCISTLGGESVMFNIGAGRELQFAWVSDDKIVGIWKRSPDDYDHYEYVVIDAITGKGHVLPFDTDYYLGFDVDVATGIAYLRGRSDGPIRAYDSCQDKVLLEIERGSPLFPQDPGCYRFVGVENGIGMMFAGFRHWVLIGWNGQMVERGNISWKGIRSLERTLGERCLFAYMEGYKKVVVSLKNGPIVMGPRAFHSVDGKLLIEGDSVH